MQRFGYLVPGIAAWAAALYGVLLIGRLPGQWGHAICGPWGCGPTLQALVACHGFWLVLMSPAVVAAARCCQPLTLWRVGIALVAVGIAGLAGMGIWEAANWLPQVADGRSSYLVQRYLFSLATLVEVPIVEATLAGVVLATVAKHQQPASRQPAP